MTEKQNNREVVRLGARAWGVTLAALAIPLVGTFIPIPGVQWEVLSHAMAGDGGGLALVNLPTPTASIFALGAGALLLVRGLLAALVAFVPAAKGMSWRIGGFILFLLLCAGQAWLVVVGMESMNAQSLAGDVVLNPGWGFRLVAILSMVAAAAVLWLLATWITRRGIGHGPLVLYGAWELLLRLEGMLDTGAGVAAYGFHLGLLAPVGMALPAAVVLLYLWWRPVEAWPLTVREKLAFLSPVDCLVVPYAVTATLSFPLWGAVTTIVDRPDMAANVLNGFTVLTALGVTFALLWWLHGRGHGDTPSGERAREPRRPFGALVTGVLVVPATLALIVLGFALEGGLTRMLEPGPFEGEGSFELTLRSDGGNASRDAHLLQQRLDALGVSAEVVDAREGRIELLVRNVRDGWEVAEAVAPQRQLAFHIVADDQGPVQPQTYAADPAQLAPVLERARAIPERLAYVECQDRRGEQEPQCAVRLVHGEPIITGEDVIDAMATHDEYTNAPQVTLTFSEAGAARFARGTGDNVDRELAIVLDEQIISAPVIRERIPGGRAMISLGSVLDYQGQWAEAQSLAVSLQAGALSFPWEIVGVQQVL